MVSKITEHQKWAIGNGLKIHVSSVYLSATSRPLPTLASILLVIFSMPENFIYNFCNTICFI